MANRWRELKSDDFVAAGRGGRMLAYKTLLYGLKDLCRKVGVTVITPHEMRHSWTEVWVKFGASVEHLRRLLNHKSLTSTKAYLHRTDEELTRLGDRIDLPIGMPEIVSTL